ncbi:hypothetical protein Ddye_010808 [Dipteronia dyeriana]|uniref:Homeobox domain-containing protein n=1 Tax=Dipteronia dyeriana TaxID=168575 RepID=A0AAD9XEK1_9ROSI|nr:hypothetical protein Ddye_010808 [Dipteronia dyeriana]
MAEGFEPYHVPQQSRRDKLRIVAQNQNHHPSNCVVESTASGALHQALLPLYDSSLLSSDLINCANNTSTTSHHHHHDFQHHNHNPLSASAHPIKTNPVCVVKDEGANLMAFVGGTSHHHHPYLDPHSSLNMNPSSIQDINNPFLYSPHNLQSLRDFDHHQSYNSVGGGEVILFKPEPLSLSLSSHSTTHQNNLPLELNLQRFSSTIGGGGGGGGGYVVPGVGGGGGGSASTSNDASRSSVPLGPFTGYASILKGSRFLKPAQQLLEEFCNVGQGIYAEKITADSSLMDPPLMNLTSSGAVDDDPLISGDGNDNRRKKSRLISMLDEVYRRYKQYYQQMQAVVASFEYVAGLGNAAPFANLALKTMSKHFKCLKNAITDQLQFTNNKAQVQMNHGKDEAPRFGNTDRSLFRPVQNSGFLERQPVWRPQRGLPERAVTVLRAWLFEHFLHPYPTDTDKLMLAKQTGLSRSQVSNWFINARVRLWKPMVEEIHMLETRQAQKSSQREDRNANRISDCLPPSNTLPSELPSTSAQRVPETSSKRTIHEFSEMPVVSHHDQQPPPPNLSYHSLSSHHPHVNLGGSSGVSLTLGLHQNNNAIGLSEPYHPINGAQRFGLGLETNNEGYVLGGYEPQTRHFGRDVMGGQLLHDFVG